MMATPGQPARPANPSQAGGNTNSLYLEKMQALTDAITNLTTYVQQGASTAASQRAQAGNDASVANSALSPAPFVPGGAEAAIPGWNSVGPNASTPDKVNAAFQSSVAQQQLQQMSDQPDKNASYPPNSPNPLPSSAPQATISQEQEQQAIQALTWQELGQVGGPVGALRTRQFALSRNLEFAGNVASGIGQRLPTMGPPAEDGTPQTNPLTALGAGLNAAAGSRPLQTALIGSNAAIQAMSGWRNTGLQLGFGSPTSMGNSFLGINNPLSQTAATEQGASLEAEMQALRGRWAGSFGSGLSKDQSTGLVETLAGQGFSNAPRQTTTRGLDVLPTTSTSVNGDNTLIARTLQPLVAQGVDPTDAAQLTPQLRNASDSLQDLTSIIGQLATGAQAAKMPMDQFIASLVQVGQTEEAMGGTMQGGEHAGLDFTQSTGLAPALLGSLMQSPIVQALAIGQNGVLPSGVPNLSGGAQNQAVMSAINMLSPAFSNLNKNQYTNVPGLGKQMTSSGSLNQAAQMGQLLGIPTAEMERLLKQQPYEAQITKMQTALGQQGGGKYGEAASGIYQYLGQSGNGGTQTEAQSQGAWNKLSAADRKKATTYWNSEVGNNLGALQKSGALTQSQIKAMYKTNNVGQRMNELNTDLNKNQQNQTGNMVQVQATLALKGSAAKIFKAQGVTAKMNANAGGSPISSLINSPQGDALAASNNPVLAGLGDATDIGSGAQAGSMNLIP
jgi:hypothetical protein